MIKRTNRHERVSLLALCATLWPALLFAQATSSRGDLEQATARYFDSIKSDGGLLTAFLRELPKGGDLHTHLSGAVYAETFIDWAAQAGICIRNSDNVAVPPPCDSASTTPATTLLGNDDVRGRVIDAWSMRNWTGALESGHDHFFATFGKFNLASRGRDAEMIAEVARRAHAGRVGYLEIMDTPPDGAIALGARVGWDDDLPRLREKLRAAGHAQVVSAARTHMTQALERKKALLSCGTAQAEPACGVEIRMLYQVLRGMPPERVFAQILTAFEAASVDSVIVGFNMVMPEDGYISMRDFSLHMRMIDYLHGLYPNVRITLHAGELAPGLVPPEGLRFHIRESIEKGHASRIGHGVDVLHEDNALALLRDMAARDVAVEICLTSNKVILGVSGREHPLAAYQAAGVPTLLATDDEGVSRSEMTLEYKRAVQDQGLSYATLKQMARNSLQYAFIQGASLWADARKTQPVAQCGTSFERRSADARCSEFLARSPKARLQWQLEEDFVAFEAAVKAGR